MHLTALSSTRLPGAGLVMTTQEATQGVIGLLVPLIPSHSGLGPNPVESNGVIWCRLQQRALPSQSDPIFLRNTGVPSLVRSVVFSAGMLRHEGKSALLSLLRRPRCLRRGVPPAGFVLLPFLIVLLFLG